MATTPNLKVSPPPQGLVPITDQSWQRWFTEVVWPVIGAGWNNSGPQGTFTQLQVGKAQWTSGNAFQELINVDQGLYVNYFTTVEQIAYGFACNVHHSAGSVSALTVAGQFNAWGEVGSKGDIYGVAATAIGQPFSGTRNLIAFEPDIANFVSSSTGAKWGVNPVFKDRMDGAASTVEGLGSNLFNYNSIGTNYTSQARSSAGEYCGWNIGEAFFNGWCDECTVPAWVNTTSYFIGNMVTHGGNTYLATQASINVAPAGVDPWVLRNGAGSPMKAVGIDFSGQDTGTMALMASAIRFRSTQYFHWEESGVIGTKFDAATSLHYLSANAGGMRFGVDVGTGITYTGQAGIALGGGAAATLGTIGGGGPTTAAQNKWEKVVNNGVTYWRPLWI